VFFGLELPVRTERILGWLAPAYLTLCLLGGGASGPRAGVLANAVLQVLAVALILYILWTRRGAWPSGTARIAWGAGVLLILLIGHLLPLPPAVWQALPGREGVVSGYSLLGIEPPFLPLSLAPLNSISSMLWLLPPSAMFLLAVHCDRRKRRRLAWTILTVAVISICWGAAQLLGGEGSNLRFYEVTNRGSPVGFFANANHQAAFLLCAIAFSGFLAAQTVSRAQERTRRQSSMFLAVATSVFLIFGTIIVGSMAGYGLLVISIGLTFLIYRRAVYGSLSLKWVVALTALLLIFVGTAVFGPVGDQVLADKFADQPTSRKVIWTNTAKLVPQYFPVGSGLGSFEDVYRTVDDRNRISKEYVNHAHNDYLEVSLELGLAGIALLIAFLLWWIERCRFVWGRDFEGASLGRAASVAIGILLAFTLVEYPLRTSALAALFSTAVALLLPSPNYTRDRSKKTNNRPGPGPRHLVVE
jgi:O-antigen ligase